MSAGPGRASASPGSPLAGRGLAAVIAAGLAAAYLIATGSTHAALSGGSVGWSGTVVGHSAGLVPATPAEQAQIGDTSQYSNVLWARQPGGEVSFGFELHNGGLIPVTVSGLSLRGFLPGVIHDLATAGAQVGPGFGDMRPFHPVTIGPGGSVQVGLIVRVVCDPTVRLDARLPDHRGDRSILGEATSPVVVHYRALGMPASQTLSLVTPVLLVQPYRACA